MDTLWFALEVQDINLVNTQKINTQLYNLQRLKTVVGNVPFTTIFDVYGL